MGTVSDDPSNYLWPVDTTCLPDLPDTDSDDPAFIEAEAAMEAAQALASQVLWALSGRQYGIWQDTVRPCPEPYMPGIYRTWPVGTYEIYSWADDGWTITGCGCIGSCTRSGPSAVHLPGPVYEITAVTINGAEIDESEYVLEGDILYRAGAAWWPAQNLSKPTTETGTWKVDYLRGIDPPAGTAKLVGLLTAEFYNACTGGKCRLPRSVTELSRQGVTHRVVNPNEIYATGKTGIPEIDLWLAAVNPNQLQSAPVVL